MSQKAVGVKKQVGDLILTVDPRNRRRRYIYSRFLIAVARVRSAEDVKTTLAAVGKYFHENQLASAQVHDFVKELSAMVDGASTGTSVTFDLLALFTSALRMSNDEFNELFKTATSTLAVPMTEEAKDVVNLLLDAASKMDMEVPPETLLCKDDVIERYRKNDGGDVYVVYLCYGNRRYPVKVDATADLKKQVKQIYRQLVLIYDELKYPPPLPQDVRLFRELVVRFLSRRASYEVELEKLAVRVVETIESRPRAKIYETLEQAKNDPNRSDVFYVVAEKKFYVLKQTLRKVLGYKNYAKELEKLKELGILEEVRPKLAVGRAKFYVFDAEKFSDLIGYDVATVFNEPYIEKKEKKDDRDLDMMPLWKKS